MSEQIQHPGYPVCAACSGDNLLIDHLTIVIFLALSGAQGVTTSVCFFMLILKCSFFRLFPLGIPSPLSPLTTVKERTDCLTCLAGAGDPRSQVLTFLEETRGTRGEAGLATRPRGHPGLNLLTERPNPHTAPLNLHTEPLQLTMQGYYICASMKMSTMLQNNFSGPPPAAMACLKPLLLDMAYLK